LEVRAMVGYEVGVTRRKSAVATCRAMTRRRQLLVRLAVGRVTLPLLVVVLPIMLGSALLARGIASATALRNDPQTAL